MRLLVRARPLPAAGTTAAACTSAHAAGCWYERGRCNLEQAQAAVRSNEQRLGELKKNNLAAAGQAAAELAKVRAEAAAQLVQLRAEVKENCASRSLVAVLAEVKAELKAEVATKKRESAAQLQRIQQQVEVALGTAAALERFRMQAARAVPPAPTNPRVSSKVRRVWSRWPLRGRGALRPRAGGRSRPRSRQHPPQRCCSPGGSSGSRRARRRGRCAQP
jgi:hypothetical protein